MPTVFITPRTPTFSPFKSLLAGVTKKFIGIPFLSTVISICFPDDARIIVITSTHSS